MVVTDQKCPYRAARENDVDSTNGTNEGAFKMTRVEYANTYSKKRCRGVGGYSHDFLLLTGGTFGLVELPSTKTLVGILKRLPCRLREVSWPPPDS